MISPRLVCSRIQILMLEANSWTAASKRLDYCNSLTVWPLNVSKRLPRQHTSRKLNTSFTKTGRVTLAASRYKKCRKLIAIGNITLHDCILSHYIKARSNANTQTILLPIDVAIDSRAIIVIESGLDGQKRHWSQLNNWKMVRDRPCVSMWSQYESMGEL